MRHKMMQDDEREFIDEVAFKTQRETDDQQARDPQYWAWLAKMSKKITKPTRKRKVS